MQISVRLRQPLFCAKSARDATLRADIGIVPYRSFGGLAVLEILQDSLQIVATVNLFLNVLSTIVLRYNTPMLKSLLKRLKRTAPKEKNP